MTLDGTNTWIVGAPERGAPVVIDPGPLDGRHLERILDACSGWIADIVLTHRHGDHSDGAAQLARLAGCGVRAADPRFQLGPRALADGDQLDVPAASITAYSTPGHTSDSFSLLVRGEDSVTRLATGDMVLGRGTTVIAHPDGNLKSYFASLTKMSSLVDGERIAEILPGHGPRVDSPQQWLAFYRAHRLERLQQVREALAAGASSPAEVVARVYADVDRSVWPAAEQSVAAQLEYLTGVDHQ
jgi:glyoxylase-like metal-dependent hydrolase (beta-lactamase superfamily II)